MPKKSTRPLGVMLLSIGDELLDGRIQNTNAAWFGEELRKAGVPIAEVRCVSDRTEDIVRNLKEGLHYPIVVCTGGLGPTNDDRTLASAAAAFKRPLGQTKASFEHVKSRYEARKMDLTEARLRLTQVPKGCRVMQNPTGTAPGVDLKIDSTNFFFLPGPPHECRPMFAKEILPLAKKKVATKKLVRRNFWRVYGKTESGTFEPFADKVADLEKRFPDTFTFGVHISFPCIDLTLEVWDVKGAKKPPAKEVESFCQEISQKLGSFCFTRERENLVDVVSRELANRKLTLATAESCTGGLLGKLLTDIPGSSAYYWGGVVSYDYSAKEILLGVKKSSLEKHGAVSDQVVREMADGARNALKTDFALSLSGVAGPGGGTAQKPVGTIYVALSTTRGTKTLHQVVLGGRGSRDQNRVAAIHLALDLLRSELAS
jgi:nicotinamide-nucleotide amidase